MIKEVVCDTNVWYEELPIVEGTFFSPTFCSIFELTHSTNLIKRFEDIEKAIKQIYNGGYLERYFCLNPFSHIIFLDSGKAPYLYDESKIIEKFKEIATNKVSKEDLIQQVNPFLKAQKLRKISQFLNASLVKKNVRIDKNDIEHVRQWTKKYIAFRVNNWAKTVLDIEYNIGEDFDWTKIDFFLEVKSEFIRRVIFEKMQYKPKDMYDLWNMVYVQPGTFYWTKEGEMSNKIRWHSLINEVKRQDYLFKL